MSKMLLTFLSSFRSGIGKIKKWGICENETFAFPCIFICHFHSLQELRWNTRNSSRFNFKLVIFHLLMRTLDLGFSPFLSS